MANQNQKVSSAGSFQVLLGLRAESWDPSTMPNKPATTRATARVGTVLVGGKNVSGRFVLSGGAVSGKTKAFTVVNNDFSSGFAEIIFGDNRIIGGIDYAIGEDEDETAANIAAAISAFEGFKAIAVDDVVTVTTHPVGIVEFRVLHHGSVSNFEVNSAGGFFDGGSPRIGV